MTTSRTTGDLLLPAMVGRVVEIGLQTELTDHLGYEPHAIEGRGSGNSRNGSFAKTVATEIGEVPVQVPRDRTGTFDPMLVPHGTRRLAVDRLRYAHGGVRVPGRALGWSRHHGARQRASGRR